MREIEGSNGWKLTTLWGERQDQPENRTDPEVWVHPATKFSPNYTKRERPYGYSEFFLMGNRSKAQAEGVHAEYSDRLRQRDSERFHELWKEHVGVGDYWDRASREKIEKFLRAYFRKPELKLVAVAEGCNVSNGYPYWIVWFTTGERPALAEEG